MGAQPRWHPVIDYARHPAYGAVLPRPTLRLRLQALVAFARGLALIGGRRLADYEHLPRPRDKAHKLRWMLFRLPMYLRLILRQRWQRLVAGDRYRPDSAAGSAVLKNLQTDGVAALALDPAQQHALRTMLAPHFAELAARLADKPQASRSFDDNRLWLAASHHPEVYAWFTRLLSQTGVLAAARAYLRRPVEVAHVVPQINCTTDTFWGQPYPDLGLPATACDYFHFDATYRVVKLIVYTDAEVGPGNGPFSYVRGSHRANAGFWDGMVRRANDYGGLSSPKHAARSRFCALPRMLQRKAAFGRDLVDDDPCARRLLAHEWVITADQGRVIVFDPEGVHRGGMVRQGERRVVSVLLVETRGD